MLMMKSTSPRSISSMTQPPSPAGVSAPAMVRPMVVSWLFASILSLKIAAGLAQAGGVEGLEAFVDQPLDVGGCRAAGNIGSACRRGTRRTSAVSRVRDGA